MLNFIVNPRALLGKGKDLLKKIEARLKEVGKAFQFILTQAKDEATEIARRLTEAGERKIIAVGGDGTMNEVLAGLANPSECTFGLIPAGTGNDFASSANLPSCDKALDYIVNGEAKPTDYIQFDDGRRCLNIAGLGLDVDILLRCEKSKISFQKIKYFKALLSSLAHYRGCKIRVEANGEVTEHNAFIAAVCNGKQLGGGIPLCPVAKIDDGKMDLVVVDYPKRSKILGALIKLMQGKILTVPFAHHILCDRAEVFPETESFAQYDGEIYPISTFGATLVPGGLMMYRG